MNNNDLTREIISAGNSGGVSFIIWGLVVIGFFILIWGLSDLIKEDNQQENKYIKSVIKIIVGSLFIGIEQIYFVTMIFG